MARFQRSRLHLYLLIVLSAFIKIENIQAQVSSYIFSQSTNSYVPEGPAGTPADIFSSTWDDNSKVFPMPFNFTYNGVTYTTGGTIGIDTDSWLAFSTGSIVMTGNLSGGSWVNVGPNTGMYLYGSANNNGFAGFNCDLNYQSFATITATLSNGSNILTNVSSMANIQVGTRLEGTGIPTGAVVSSFAANTITLSTAATANGTNTITPYSSIVTFIRGSAPNRQFIIQWTQAKRFSNATNDNFNFQMIINEGGGVASAQSLQVIWGPCSTGSSLNIETQVGLRGNSSADFNARKSSSGWLTTIAATANTDSVRLNNSLLPSNGLTFTWAPCAAAPQNAGSISGSASVCAGSSSTYSITAVTGASSYNWSYSGSGATFSTTTVNPTNTFSFSGAATAGTITVTPVNPCGSGGTSSFGINIMAQPSATFSYGTGQFCSSAGAVPVNFSGTTGGTFSINPAAGVTINPTTGGINIGASSGTFTISYAVTSGGCSNTINSYIQVSAPPAATASASPSVVCNNASSQLSVVPAASYTMASIPYSLLSNASPTTLWNTYADEQISSAITLPYTFNYYGAAITQLFVSTNGFVTLQTSSNSLTPQTLPSATTPNNLIALAWDDLVVDPSVNPGAAVRYFTNGVSPNRVMVIEYYKVSFYATTNAGEVSGQIRLYESDNHIEVAVTKVSDPDGTFSKTLGIENSTGTSGLSPAGRNNQVWNVTSEAWAFYPSTFTYQWSPATFLNNTTISNPLASGLNVTTNYSVHITNQQSGCAADIPVTVTAGTGLSGTYTVGAAGNYPTLTAAINAYNTQCIAGPIVFSLIDAAYNSNETFPIVIQSNSYASAVNTLTIKPAAGINPVITGISSVAIIKINAADYVTIDGSNVSGGTTRNLTLRNTSTNSTTSTVIWLASTNASNGASNNSISNCIIKGNSSTTTFTALLSSGSIAGDVAEAANANNRYINNQVHTCQTAIALVGPSGNEAGNMIQNNVIGSSIAAEKLSWSGIEIYQQAGAVVSGNTVLGITSANSTTATGIAVYGTQSGCEIHANKIYNIRNTSTSGWGSNGLFLAASIDNINLAIYNNFISDVASYGYDAVSEEENGHGVVIFSGGGYNIYNNTIILNTSQTVSGNPACLFISSGLSNGSINLVNNILSNSQTQTGPRYSIASLSAKTVFASINYNDYYSTGANLAYLSANVVNFSALQTAFGSNLNSVNILPVVVSSSDLHLVPASNTTLSNLATPISTVLTDIDGNTRNGTNPDIGADEWVRPNTGSWVGRVSIQWTNSANWEDNVVPDFNTDISVTGGYTFLPTIVTVQAVRNISMSSPAVITIANGTLQLYGDITNAGGLFSAASGIIETKRTGAAQTLSGSWFSNRNLSTLVNGNSTGTTLSATAGDTLKILSALLFGSVTSSIFTTNNNLTLASSDTATARLGQILNSNNITGNVTVERYIPNHTKAWQLLAIPTSGATIKASWQEGSTSPNSNPKPGYGTQIASDVVNATTHPTPGFDAIGVAGPGMKTYNSVTGLWDGVTSTALPIYNQKGYMLFVRGDRSATAFNSPATATRLRTTGAVFKPLNAPPVTNVSVAQFTSVGNPYPSAINFDNVALSGGVQRNFYVWDPKLTNSPYSVYGYGAFQSFSSNFPAPGYVIAPGAGSYGSGNTNIESGQAFFVYAPFNPGSVTFNESAKTYGSNLVTRQTDAALQQLRTNLLLPSANDILLDGIVTQFYDMFENEVDDRDAFKLSTFGENLSCMRYGNSLVVERRKPATVNDTIFYSIGALRSRHYKLGFIPENWAQTDLNAWLVDSYTGQRTPVSLISETKIEFEITADEASHASNRFMLVFAEPVVLPIGSIELFAKRISNNSVDLKWTAQNEHDVDHYTLERSVDAVHFAEVYQKAAININGNETYVHQDHEAPTSGLFYRIKAFDADGTFALSNVVRVEAVTKDISLSIYPNPATEILTISLTGFNHGEIRLLDNSGKMLSKYKFSTTNNAFEYKMNVKPFPSEVYIIEVRSGSKRSVVKFRKN